MEVIHDSTNPPAKNWKEHTIRVLGEYELKDTVQQSVSAFHRYFVATGRNSQLTMPQTLSVAILGSSGGGTATLGHTDPAGLLTSIQEELAKCHARVVVALFVALDSGKGMDLANEQLDRATLWEVDHLKQQNEEDGKYPFICSASKYGLLSEVNQFCREKERKIARAIENDEIDGIICISCHVGIFQHTLRAASKKNIPVTGSGGTSLAMAVSLYHVRLVGNAGGSVATTSFTRAVSYTNSLCGAWKRMYEPWNIASPNKSAHVISVLNSCLPAFWGVCLLKQSIWTLTTLPEPIRRYLALTLPIDEILVVLEFYALPTSCAVVMACSGNESLRKAPTSLLILASVIASLACKQSIVAGLLAGWLVSKFATRFLYWCIFHNVPATMTNLIVGGGVGAVLFLVIAPVAQFLRLPTFFLRYALLHSLIQRGRTWRACFGFFLGCGCCYASKVGWYHSFILPLILIEIEDGSASFLGAIDELCLVLVCAGICAGNIISQKILVGKTELRNSDMHLSKRGLYVNLLCGDFVEVCYPYMERHPLINVVGYVASGISVAWLVEDAQDEGRLPRSLAYVPLVVSIALARNMWFRFAQSCALAFFISFSGTVMFHAYALKGRL